MFWKKGRTTVKTTDYTDYQNKIADQLMDVVWPYAKEQVEFEVEAGLSNRGADLDNIMKPLFDTFQLVFEEFNDNKVYYVEATKTIVPKGDEFIRVEIRRYTGDVSKREVSTSIVSGLEVDEIKTTEP